MNRDESQRGKALQRLQRDAPGLYAEVLAGTMSAHAAMVAAGFRARSCTILPDRPYQVATVLRRKMNKHDLAELIKLLGDKGL